MSWVEMPLLTGGFVILDQDQYDSLEHKDDWKEYVRNRVFIHRGSRKKKTEQFLHQELFPHKLHKEVVVHKNGNPYDFRRENIRIVSRSRLLSEIMQGRLKPKPADTSFEVNGCIVVKAPQGRCKNMLDCPDYLTCLDKAALKNWGGWTALE